MDATMIVIDSTAELARARAKKTPARGTTRRAAA
jgi:hypothetical protein